MGRSPCCNESGLKKGPWTTEEDQKLITYIHKHGHGSWRALPKHAGLNRCGKSCRLRWTNYLRPDIKRGNFSPEEEHTILSLHSILGNKWSAIATRLPGRTDNEIKNFWNTHLRKKLINMDIDPEMHQPLADVGLFATLPQLVALAGLKELVGRHCPWNYALRLQAEAAQLAKLQCFQYLLPSPTTNGLSSINASDINPMSLLSPAAISSVTSPFPLPSPQTHHLQQYWHEFPCMSDKPLVKGDNVRSETVLPPSAGSPFLGAPASAGDACSSFSYDINAGPSFWLEDFTEYA